MRRASLILVMALIAAACGSDDATDTSTSAAPATVTEAPATTTQAPASTTSAPAATTTAGVPETTSTITEPPEEPREVSLVVTSVDFDEEFVVITNVSDAEYSLEGHFVCNFPTYVSIGDLGSVAAGESFTVQLADLGAGSSGGEVGVYTTNDFGNPDAMVTYVEWGTPNHGRSSVAVAAGLWTEGDFVDNGRASFQALTTGGSGDDYELVE